MENMGMEPSLWKRVLQMQIYVNELSTVYNKFHNQVSSISVD